LKEFICPSAIYIYILINQPGKTNTFLRFYY